MKAIILLLTLVSISISIKFIGDKIMRGKLEYQKYLCGVNTT